jgi:hypothetical protein
MISLILDWALFFLVLFFLIPGVMMVAMLTRDTIAQNRHQGLWHRDQAKKSPG